LSEDLSARHGKGQLRLDIVSRARNELKKSYTSLGEEELGRVGGGGWGGGGGGTGGGGGGGGGCGGGEGSGRGNTGGEKSFARTTWGLG